MPSHWKSAVDPRSGQTYFFHEVTRETQWRKPMELATDEEKSAMEEKEQKEKDFFAAMEANILSSLSRGVIPGTPAKDIEETFEGEGNTSGMTSRSSIRRVKSRAGRPELVRTISTMDESVLADVILRQPSFRSVKSGFSNREISLQLDDLRGFVGSRPSHVRDGFDFNSSYSSSAGSHSSILETLEEDAGDSSCGIAFDSFPGLHGSNPREGSDVTLGDGDNDKLINETRMLEQSISTREDLNWEETRALNKLFSLTKEMIDCDGEQMDDKDEVSQSAIATSGPKIVERQENPPRTLRRVTESNIGRTLPRELELEESDGKKEKPTTLVIPRKEKAARMLANSGKTAADLLRPAVHRRNTCGTMYIRTTMSAPDKDATIRVSFLRKGERKPGSSQEF